MALGSSITSIKINGYRPFGEFRADVGRLEVLVGANGSGKSSLFEFLMVLRDGMDSELPVGLIRAGSHRSVYHSKHVGIVKWEILLNLGEQGAFEYGGELEGGYGNDIRSEYVRVIEADHMPTNSNPTVEKTIQIVHEGKFEKLVAFRAHDHRKLRLGSYFNPMMSPTLLAIQEQVSAWRFYNSFNIAADKIRQPVITEQNAALAEDASNLSDVLQHLRNEHEEAFEELKRIMRLFVPGFKNLKVKSYGAPGQVMAFWQEEGVDEDLSLADLSDGIFRLLCWTVLCVTPNPPSLICIDEPDQGVHPRTLPILAGLFKKASQRTQIFLATHNSYFLSQFDVEDIAVMRKEDGEAKFIKPKDSKVLMAMLEDFGSAEIEALHRSEELERLP